MNSIPSLPHSPIPDFISRLGAPDGLDLVKPRVLNNVSAPHSISLLSPLNEIVYVAIDCETTGNNPPQLIELGAVAFNNTNVREVFETLVHCASRIDPYAQRVHGIARHELRDAPSIRDVIEQFSMFIQDAVLVEHSADAFDTRLLANLFIKTMNTPLDMHSIDTTRLARVILNIDNTIGLERLCTELGVVHRNPHYALADAEATAACYRILVREGQSRHGWKTLGDVLAVAESPYRTIQNKPKKHR